MSGEDSSSITRDIENYNLIVTLREKLQRDSSGSGFGSEYTAAVKADAISPSGFSSTNPSPPTTACSGSGAWEGSSALPCLWMIYPIQAYFRRAATGRAARPIERAAGLATLAGHGDGPGARLGRHGVQQLHSTVAMFAACYAVAAKLCARHGNAGPPGAATRDQKPMRRVATEVVGG